MTEMITVPICNDCGKPHMGRSISTERCWCDTFGNWHWGKITKEQPSNNSAEEKDA